MTEDFFKIALFALTATYLGLIIAFQYHLENHHKKLWDSFSGAQFFPYPKPGQVDSYRFVRTGLYALLQGAHWKLNDKRATAYVFAIRALLVLTMALIYAVRSSSVR